VRQGLLLLAHGARDADWAEPFLSVVNELRALRPDCEVALAFLEFMQPDLLSAGASMVQLGCLRVDVVPLFLGAGGHVRKDVPRLIQCLAAEHRAVHWRLQRAVGEEPAVISALARAAATGPTRGDPQ
jgi:sirohydrochlorin cobaltochelatase